MHLGTGRERMNLKNTIGNEQWLKNNEAGYKRHIAENLIKMRQNNDKSK